LDFTFDGRPLRGYAGDTLASALLANGITVVGRSFKYHRPRGFLAAGPEEPNGLFTVGRAARATPNLPGTLVELHDGLEARRQNGWPSVDFDLMAINSLAAPLLRAGFYYKTFMGPRRGSWMFYEPFIRRAAGLGQAFHERDPDRYHSEHGFADVLIIGGGAAGLSAALTAGRTGARVVLADLDSHAGGHLLDEAPTHASGNWLGAILAELRSLPNVELRLRTTALGLYDGNTVPLLERRDAMSPDPARGQAREVLTVMRARAIVFACGATERPLVFGDNDRPGVMLASAARSYANRHAIDFGERVVIATNNDAAYESAATLAVLGATVTIVDSREQVTPALTIAGLKGSIELRTGMTVERAFGGRRLRAVRLAGRGAGTIDCSLLGMSGGWVPNVHLTSHTGVKPVYRADLDAFVPGGFAGSHFGAGAMLGTFALGDVVTEGARAGAAAARAAGRSAPEAPIPLPEGVASTARYAITPTTPPVRTRGKAFIDFQTDVTTDDVVLAHQEGFESVEHLKRYTAQGMGTDQGKTSNVNAVRMMAALRAVPMAEAGTTTFRPPYLPVSIGALAGRNTRHHFRPVRRSPLHTWHVANGASLIEAGPWLRAWHYAWAGADVGAAYIEEMRHVRAHVGLSDVSSLGKIDVQGPDAAEFLQRVYVNGFAKLPIGKARYGVMLNDDATVLDDGTTARFSETRYFMTTTTAQAAEVMSRLEFLLQTAWPELRVHVSSLTDQWAGMSLAGPRARDVLARALPGHDVSDAALPYMGCRELELDGVPVRVLRLSFSGELAFELYVPSEYGVAMWEHVLAAGAPDDIRPYGLEALASLRIEKGHVAGLELDHRTTLDDLGLGKMAGRDKAYVGRALRMRPGLQAPERWSLVGILGLDPSKPLRGGSILFRTDEPIRGHGRGYITSMTWSNELGHYIALGLYQGGLAHVGEEIICAYPLKGESVRARIVSPHFIDPEGERLHA
jgi:sarcosine oxidase subunit alpha